MVSYVVPIYVDGESIGIVGMDIDFSVFTDMVDESDIFTTGYAFYRMRMEILFIIRDLTMELL